MSWWVTFAHDFAVEMAAPVLLILFFRWLLDKPWRAYTRRHPRAPRRKL